MAANDLAVRLDAVARAPVEAGDIIGLSVAVTRGDSSVYTAAHGFADRAAGVSMSPANPLRLASVSKVMTAALALRLERAGVVSLNTPLEQLVPEVRGGSSPEITLGAALSHTSGLPDYLDDYLSSDEGFYATGAPLAESFVFRTVERTPARFPPGRHWAYSNTGFYLAAIALERAAEQPWAELIHDSLAVPLGLQSLRTCDEYIEQGDFRGYEVTGGDVRESPMYVEPGVKGDGGLAMTAADLALFARSLEHEDFLGPDGFLRMTTPTRLAGGLEVDYGLGARLGTLGGHSVWGHTGSLESYVGTVLRFPADDLTIAVVQNTSDAATGALVLALRLAEAALALPHADLTPAASFDPAPYVGDYVGWGESSDAYRSRISAADGGLARTWLHAPDNQAALTPLGAHEFGRADWPRDRMRFHVQDGAAVGYSVYAAGLFAGFHWRAEP